MCTVDKLHVRHLIILASFVITMVNLILVVKAYAILNGLIARQIRMCKLLDYLAVTVSSQILPKKMWKPFLDNIGYDYEKLEQDRLEYMKWYIDPKGNSWVEPSNMFEAAPSDSPDYDTLQLDPKTFFKPDKGSSNSAGGHSNQQQKSIASNKASGSGQQQQEGHAEAVYVPESSRHPAVLVPESNRHE